MTASTYPSGPRLRRWVAAAAWGAALVVAVSGCGDDEVGRDEFVDHMVETTTAPREGAEGKRWRETWRCVFDELEGSSQIDRLMDVGRGDAMPQDLSAAISPVLYECQQEAKGERPATDAPGSTGPSPPTEPSPDTPPPTEPSPDTPVSTEPGSSEPAPDTPVSTGP